MPLKATNKKMNLVAVVIPIAIMVLPLIYSVTSRVFARDVPTSLPFLERPDQQYDNCVRETEFMRFHHWELLREIREEVVRHGIRGEIKLDSCRECHPSREKFCNRCHNAVNLTLDCFGCHYYPEQAQSTPDQVHLSRTNSSRGRTTTDRSRRLGR
jgi:hypothetical protein